MTQQGMLKLVEKTLCQWVQFYDGESMLKCPLCFSMDGCGECPISKKVNNIGCSDTPVIQWDYHRETEHNCDSSDLYSCRRIPLCPTCKQLALDVILFLNEVCEDVEKGILL